MQSRTVRALARTMTLAVLMVVVLSATAAAADYHPGGYDKECVLCQINHLPFAETAEIPFIPESVDFKWMVLLEDYLAELSCYVISLPGRSPPAC